MLNEVLEQLQPMKGDKFIDGTAGLGGYIVEILDQNKNAEVLAIDLDQTSLDKLKQKLVQRNLLHKCRLVHGSYKDMGKFAEAEGFSKVSGIILDLGFSTLQLMDPSRGFSFQTEGPLDMRYNTSQKLTAAEVVNKYSQEELQKIIKEYGEENFAKKIASNIVVRRKISPIGSTHALSGVVRESVPKSLRYKADDNVRRVFQAIRIEVNSELENLKTVLPHALGLLQSQGRLAVISFHSLEDRIVKRFFKEQTIDCVCPADFPTCICNHSPLAKIITKKPITASDREIKENPKSKPAKLRVLEKL